MKSKGLEMTKIIAKFSNGHTDEYKGNRLVKAAWMVIYPNGHIDSGHSLDRVKAHKTASGTIRFVPDEFKFDRPRTGSIAYLQYWHKAARERGYSSHKAAYDAYCKKLAAYRSQCKIEVINLGEGQQ